MGLVGEVNNMVTDRAKFGVLADKVFVSATNEGDPVPLPLPYIMIFCDNGQYTSELIAQHDEQFYFNYTVHFVGETREQVDWLVDHFYDRWHRWRPAIPGVRFFKMKPNFSTPDNTNDAVHPPFLYRVDEWGLRGVVGRKYVPADL